MRAPIIQTLPVEDPAKPFRRVDSDPSKRYYRRTLKVPKVLVREPRLMVPGMQPLGPVKIKPEFGWIDGLVLRGSTNVADVLGRDRGNVTGFTIDPTTVVRVVPEGIGIGTAQYDKQVSATIGTDRVFRTFFGAVAHLYPYGTGDNWYSTTFGRPTYWHGYESESFGFYGAGSTLGRSYCALTREAGWESTTYYGPYVRNDTRLQAGCVTITGPWESDTVHVAVNGDMISTYRGKTTLYPSGAITIAGTSSNFANSYVNLICGWSRDEISPAVAREISRDPFCMLEPA